jgi:ABC-2 type transport system permease protein
MRQPFVWVPTLVFPLFFFGINAGGLDAASAIPGWPRGVSYLTFALGTTFVMAAMNGVMVSGGGLAEDIQSGFLNRLSLTRMGGAALLGANLAAMGVIALAGTAIYIGVGLAAGAHFKTGVAGAIVVVLLTLLISLAFGCIGVYVAIATGSAQAPQALFPILFVMLFLSSMALPRNLISQRWFEIVATANPMSYLIEAPRSLLVTGWDVQAIVLGGGIAGGIFAVALILSTMQLRGRISRT